MAILEVFGESATMAKVPVFAWLLGLVADLRRMLKILIIDEAWRASIFIY